MARSIKKEPKRTFKEKRNDKKENRLLFTVFLHSDDQLFFNFHKQLQEMLIKTKTFTFITPAIKERIKMFSL